MVPTLIFQFLMHFSHPQRMYVGRFLSRLHGVVTALRPLHVVWWFSVTFSSFNCAHGNGYFQTENCGILRRTEEIIKCESTLWSSWITETILWVLHICEKIRALVCYTMSALLLWKDALSLFKLYQKIFILCSMSFYLYILKRILLKIKFHISHL